MEKIVYKNQEIGTLLKKLRKDKELTVNQLGSQLDISKSTIKSYELGYRVPGLKNAIKLCNFFNISLDELILYQLD